MERIVQINISGSNVTLDGNSYTTGQTITLDKILYTRQYANDILNNYDTTKDVSLITELANTYNPTTTGLMYIDIVQNTYNFYNKSDVGGTVYDKDADGIIDSDSVDSVVTPDSVTSFTNKTLADISNTIHANQLHHKIKATEDILKGQPLSYVGWNLGENAIEVKLANQATDVSIGLAGEDLLNGEFGMIISVGFLDDIDTSLWTEGTILYVDGTGVLTSTEPTTGFAQPIAFVLRQHAINGTLQVNADYPKQDALDTRFTPAGTIIADNVQNAIEEVSSDVEIINSANTDVGEWTGFIHGASGEINYIYDPVARTITLTDGTKPVKALWENKVVPELVNGWVSTAHPATLDKNYFLYYNGTAFVWSETVWEFEHLQISEVVYNTNNKFAVRETHETMPARSHRTDHFALGTVKLSGGVFSSYVLNSQVLADRRPILGTTNILDEDIVTSNVASSTGNYCIFSLGTAGVPIYTVDQADIIPYTTKAKYNLKTGNDWSEVNMNNNYHAKIFVYSIPVADDAGSQKYRTLYIMPQAQFTTKAGAESLTTKDIDWGSITGPGTQEFVAVGEIIVTSTSNNWEIEEVNTLEGSRVSQTGTPNVTIPSLSDVTAVGSTTTDEITITVLGAPTGGVIITGSLFGTYDGTYIDSLTTDGFGNIVYTDTVNRIIKDSTNNYWCIDSGTSTINPVFSSTQYCNFVVNSLTGTYTGLGGNTGTNPIGSLDTQGGGTRAILTNGEIEANVLSIENKISLSHNIAGGYNQISCVDTDSGANLVFTANGIPRLAIPNPGSGNASQLYRSTLFGGYTVGSENPNNDTNIVNLTLFDNTFIDCNTGTNGTTAKPDVGIAGGLQVIDNILIGGRQASGSRILISPTDILIDGTSIVATVNNNTAQFANYLPLTGGELTGSVTINGTVSIGTDVSRVSDLYCDNIVSSSFLGIAGSNSVGINEFSNDTTLVGNSDTAVPTEKAVKTYVDANAGGVSPVTTKGDLFTYDTADARLPVGGNGDNLVVDSTETTGLKWKKNNIAGTTGPTTTDDSVSGYEIGSVWIDTTNDNIYTCVDATTSAAVWKSINGTATNGLLVHVGATNANQLLTTSSPEKVEFIKANINGTKTGIDKNNEWDDTTHRFTVGASGKGTYLFCPYFFLHSSTTGTWSRVIVYKNGVELDAGSEIGASSINSQWDGIQGSISLDLDVGDYVEIFVDFSGASATGNYISGSSWNALNGMTISKLSFLPPAQGTDSDAIHTNVAAEISPITEKTAPVSGDWALIEDSSASNVKKRVNLKYLIKPTLSKTITIETPSATEDISIFRTDVAITVSEVIAVSVGTTPSTTYQLKHSTDRSAAGNALTTSAATTSTTTGNTATLSVVAIPANSWVWLETTAATGTDVKLTIDIRYTED